MSEAADAQAGTLETPQDAGEGPAGVYSRWMMELDLSSKTEKNWRERAKDVNCRYRDEADEQSGNNYSIDDSSFSGRYGTGERFNILYSNIQTICPALYNQSPKPDVRRRYRDRDETGKVIADVMERGLSYTMDEEDFDRHMRMAVKDSQLSGRGVTRVKYEPAFEQKTNEAGEEYDEMQYEEVEWEHVNWSDFRRGPGRIWEEVQWIGFRHTFDQDELEEHFPKTFKDIELDYTPVGLKDDDDDGDPVSDTFKRAIVWEIWDKKKKEVVFIAPSLKERPAKTVDDPLTLKGFYPIPRPLYATENTDSLTPVEPFRFYEDQANELDELTARITGVIKACKVRGIYDSTISEMSNLMDSSETFLVPATDVLPLMQAGGLEKAVWIWPIEKIAGVLIHLYTQREAVKTIIYEITGIADIMRGSSAASETLGAQQLKAQFGTMRLDDMRREVQRYARDLIRMAAEIMAEQFSPETMAIMTEVKLPTPEQKQQAVTMAQQLQAQQQPIPKKLQKLLDKPTWDECMTVLRDDQQRCYRIDIETDSTIAGDQAQEQKNITELLTGVATYIQNIGPAVEAGYLPIDAAKSMLMTAVRKFKMGREVEDALDMIGEDPDGGDEQDQGPSPEVQQMQMQMQELSQQAQQLQQENEQLKADKGAEMQRTQQDGQKAQAELGIKSREIALKEFEAQQPQPDETIKIQADIQMAREKMEFEADQAALDRQKDVALALLSKGDGDAPEGDGMNEAAAMLEAVTAALTAPKVIVRDEMGNIIGAETGMPDGGVQ